MPEINSRSRSRYEIPKLRRPHLKSPDRIKELRAEEYARSLGYELRIPRKPEVNSRYSSGYEEPKLLKPHIRTPDWTKELRAEEYARTLGHKVKVQKEDKSWGGPMIQDLKDFLELDAGKPGSVKINTGFTLAPRFQKEKHYVTPSPGTYAIPKSKPCFRLCNVRPSFEWDGCQERLQSKTIGSGVPPGRYGFTDPPKKIISRRGPYDLFTGPRDGTTIKNHFAPPKKCSPDWIPAFDTSMDRLKRPEHAHKGKWGKAYRFKPEPKKRLAWCRQVPEPPRPIARRLYYPDYTVANENYPPFGIGVLHVRPSIRFSTKPGVGRYNPRSKQKYVNGHTNCFKSTVPRTLSLAKPAFNAF